MLSLEESISSEEADGDVHGSPSGTLKIINTVHSDLFNTKIMRRFQLGSTEAAVCLRELQATKIQPV